MDTKSDIYTRLKNDHEAVAHVLQQLLEMKTGTTNAVQRQTLFTELKDSLSRHSTAEEEIFYTPLRERNETRDLIRDGQKEHERLETLLSELDRMEKNDAAWGAQLHILKGVIEHHVHEEEEKVFPRARKIFTAQRAEELGRQFEQAKARQPVTTAKSTAVSKTAETGAKVHEAGQGIAQEAQRLTDAATEKGRSLLQDQQHFFASQLGGVAAALHRTAQQLGQEEQGGMAQYVDQAAAGLERFSHGLRDRDLSSLLHQVEDFARQQPVAFIGSAAFLGFLAARFLKSSGERRHPSSSPSSSSEGAIIRPYTDTMAPSPAYATTARTQGHEAPVTTPSYDASVGVPNAEKQRTT